MYASKWMDPDAGPRQLQNKVMFDIRYYFCRRGVENIHSFDKNTFELQYDTTTGIAYVKKVKDELTKNHSETDQELITGFMPQIKNPDGTIAKMCPVRSFENYINVLDNKVNFLWQRPKNKIPKQGMAWYIAKQVGHNTHEKFMGQLCKKVQLSQHYTNHCIRVSGVTNLRRGNFTSKQVMAVSGHKSVESLAIYQRVHDDEKLMMGLCLNYCLLEPENVPHELPPPPARPQIENIKATSSETAVVRYAPPSEDTNNFDLMQLITDTMDEVNDEDLIMAANQCENAVIPPNNLVSSTSNTSVRMKTTPTTTFSNCTFGNITNLNIHIHKN